jgi:hypothetical protein
MASFASSYIKTVASQVTRSADSASMTGANFSDWYRQDEYSIYVDGSFSSAEKANQGLLQIDDSTINNWIAIGDGLGGGGNRWSVWNSSATILVRLDNTIPDNNVSSKAALGFALDNTAFYSGSTFGTDSGILINSSFNRLIIGTYRFGSMVGHIKKISYYPTRLSNTNLQALTS